MKLFHGTQEWRANAIDGDNEWIGSEKKELTTLGKPGDVVFLTDDIEEASQYGDVVFEIGNVKADFFGLAYSGKKEYTCSAKDLNENGWWKRVVTPD